MPSHGVFSMWIRVSGQSHGQPKGGYKQVRDQTLAIRHLTSNQFRCCGESSFCFAHEFFYDFLYRLYFREVGEGHAG